MTTGCYLRSETVEGRPMFYVCLPTGRVWGEYRRKATALKRIKAINRESDRANAVTV